MRFLRAYPLVRDALFLGVLLLVWWCLRFATSEPEVDATHYDYGLYAHGRLFLLQKQGYSDIYVFGTFHSNDPAILDLPKSVEDAFLSAQLFATEAAIGPNEWPIDTDAPASEISERMTELCLLAPNRSVRRLLGEQLFANLVDRLSDSETMAVLDLRAAPAPEALERMTPSCLTQYLDRPLRELKREKEGILMLDFALVRDAHDRGIPILHLESLDEQFEAQASMPLPLQIEELARLLQPSDYDVVDVTWKEHIFDYLSGDNDLRNWIGDYSAAYQTFLLRDLVVVRNHRMVERLLDQIDERTVFVATGAGHLSGDEGIVNLLAREGYSVIVLEPPP